MIVLQVQFLSMVNLSSDLLVGSMLRAATMQWHYYVMEIPTGSGKNKILLRKEEKKKR